MTFRIQSIRSLLFLAAVVFSATLGGVGYLLVSSQFERAFRERAVADATGYAEFIFNSLFQLMRTGWTRDQLQGFLDATQFTARSTNRQVEIYRGGSVSELFGPIAHGELDAAAQQAFTTGNSTRFTVGEEVRFLYALKARDICLQCHVNARIGEVLGVIDVRENVADTIADRRRTMQLALLPLIPLALLATFFMLVFIRKRFATSVGDLAQRIRMVNSLADLRQLETAAGDFGFREFNEVSNEINLLTDRVREIAVDRDMLEFHIRLLERFVLTSEVIRDWRDYVLRLLVDLDAVMPTYALFSIFKVSNGTFDLDVFWRHQPDDRMKALFERGMHDELRRTGRFDIDYAMHVEHIIADTSRPMPHVGAAQLEMQSKTLVLDSPKIGGIVGIGLRARGGVDSNRALVIESVLSTLMNVIGSVKAIDRYTRDLEYYATRDPLTNFYNQRIFWEIIENEVTRSGRHHYKFSLLMIDIDNFKSVNDTWGHAFGDSFLQTMAEALKDATRADDMLVRYGGDEFVIILPQTDLEGARGVAERALENISGQVVVTPDGKHISGSCSIGMGCYPDHAAIAKDLFMFADNMMYRAKADGKNRIALPTMEDVVEVFKAIGEKSMMILAAIETGSVRPVYQPIVGTREGGVQAVEVLSRIVREDGSMVVAEEFVAVAERMGVMHKLDYLLMERALTDAVQCGYDGLLFLNMSPRALVLNDFVVQARRIADTCRFDPERMVFEITERETIKNMAVLERFIRSLRGEGFKLAIDDFGSGFSSFHYVKRFPIDFLKIEGDFIIGMKSNEKDRALVHSIVTLAHELGIRTVAEYVEDAETLEQVAAQGIDFSQGYHIMRPQDSLERAWRQPTGGS